MEQLVIAYKKLREAARLLAAANERTLADEAKVRAEHAMERKVQQDEPLAGYEDSVWTRAVVGLALAGIAIWAGFVVSCSSLFA